MTIVYSGEGVKDTSGNLLVGVQNGAVSGAVVTGGRRNLIINGAMQVAQRGTSVSGHTGGGYTTVDRINLFQNLGALNISQSTDAPANFNYSIKYEVSTTGTASGSSIVTPVQGVEGYSTAHLNWGSSDAQSVTFSFWVKSSVTGTYGVWIRNSDANRYQPKEFSISTANTWEKKTLTFTGDTSGTWSTTNGVGINIGICLDVADNVGTADTWTSSAAYSTSNQTHFMANAGATFYFTGVQLEVGSVATPFEHRSYGEELALCQRYYNKIFDGNGQRAFMAMWETSAQMSLAYSFPIEMRAAPSLDQVTGTGYYDIAGAGTSDSFNSFTIYNATSRNCQLYNDTEISGTAGNAGMIRSANASSYLAFDAEL